MRHRRPMVRSSNSIAPCARRMTASSGLITAPSRQALMRDRLRRWPMRRHGMKVMGKTPPVRLPGMAIIGMTGRPTGIEHQSKGLTAMKRRTPDQQDETVAGNGLLHRRALLGAAGIAGAGIGLHTTGAAAEPLAEPPWGLTIGNDTPPYQTPSKFAGNVVRSLSNPRFEPRSSLSRTPHHLLEGSTTPNGLHFTINHTGIPDIDPRLHR